MHSRRGVWATVWAMLVVVLAVTESTPTHHLGGLSDKGYKYSSLSGSKLRIGAPFLPSISRGDLCEPQFVTTTHFVTETQKVVQPVTFTNCRQNPTTQVIRQPVTTTHFITKTQLQRQHVTNTQVVTKVQVQRQHVTNTKVVTDVQYVTTAVPKIVTQREIKTTYITRTQEPQVRYVTNRVTVTQPITRIQTKDLTHIVTRTQEQIKIVTKDQVQTRFIPTTQVEQRFVTERLTNTKYVTTTKQNYITNFITTTQTQVRLQTTPVIQYITKTESQVRFLTQDVVSTVYVTKNVPELRYVTNQITTSVTNIRYVTKEPAIRHSTVELIKYLTTTNIDHRCANQRRATHTQFVTQTRYVTQSEPGNCGGNQARVVTNIPVQDW